jgi:hypothetical protein
VVALLYCHSGDPPCDQILFNKLVLMPMVTDHAAATLRKDSVLDQAVRLSLLLADVHHVGGVLVGRRGTNRGPLGTTTIQISHTSMS